MIYVYEYIKIATLKIQASIIFIKTMGKCGKKKYMVRLETEYYGTS